MTGFLEDEFARHYRAMCADLKQEEQALDRNRSNKAIPDDVYMQHYDRFMRRVEFVRAAGALITAQQDEAAQAAPLRARIAQLQREVMILKKQARSSGLNPELVLTWGRTTDEA